MPMNTNEMIPGQKYIVDGHVFGKCVDCFRVLKVSGLFGEAHFCVKSDLQAQQGL